MEELKQVVNLTIAPPTQYYTLEEGQELSPQTAEQTTNEFLLNVKDFIIASFQTKATLAGQVRDYFPSLALNTHAHVNKRKLIETIHCMGKV